MDLPGKGIRVVWNPSFFLYVALFLLLLPLNWFFSWLFAAAVHEFGHLLAISLCRVTVNEIEIKPEGAIIKTDVLTRRQECVCAMAGPLGSLFCILWIRQFPILGLFATIQLIVNLLPVYPLDGGRLLRCVLMRVLPYSAALRTHSVIELLCKYIIIIIGFYLSLRLTAWIFFIFSVLFCLRQRKTPCKQFHLRVQ